MGRGQIAITDLMITIFILTILIIFFVYSWNLYNIRLNEKVEDDDMILLANKISDILVNEGKPRNWNNETVEIIGLGKDNIIDNGKLDMFLNMNYGFVKSKLNLRNYEFYFRINNLDGTNYRSFGIIPEGKIISVGRLVELNGEEKEVEIMLWK